MDFFRSSHLEEPQDHTEEPSSGATSWWAKCYCRGSISWWLYCFKGLLLHAWAQTKQWVCSSMLLWWNPETLYGIKGLDGSGKVQQKVLLVNVEKPAVPVCTPVGERGGGGLDFLGILGHGSVQLPTFSLSVQLWHFAMSYLKELQDYGIAQCSSVGVCPLYLLCRNLLGRLLVPEHLSLRLVVNPYCWFKSFCQEVAMVGLGSIICYIIGQIKRTLTLMRCPKTHVRNPPESQVRSWNQKKFLH